MSSIQAQVPLVKGKTVYMVLYNYCEHDFSIIKIMENLDDAYNHIRNQESRKKICLANIKSTKELDNIESVYSQDSLKICCIADENYHNYNICDNPNISSYIIVPMSIC